MKAQAMKRAAELVGLIAALVIMNHAEAQAGSSLKINVAGQFTIALPEGWSVYDQNAAVFGRNDGTGMVIFSDEPLTRPGESAADPELIAKADTGAIASFFVDRKPAPKNATCAELSRPTIYDIGTTIVQDPSVGAVRRFLATPPRHTEVELGGCQGVRFVVEGRNDDAENRWIIDVRAVSDGKFLYLFSLRNRTQAYNENLPTFENAIMTLEFIAEGE